MAAKRFINLSYFFRYARAYMGIQFFDSDSLLPPPFTFLSILVLAFQKCNELRIKRAAVLTAANGDAQAKHNLEINNMAAAAADQIYPQLIFQLIDNAKPRPDRHAHVVSSGNG